jgi:transcriptional regulator with XRE-family HTH domain
MKYSSKVTGQVIGRLREERGMTQEVLSGLAGIARSHLGMIECGRKSPNVETLWRIADALGLRLSRLIRLVEEAGESA